MDPATEMPCESCPEETLRQYESVDPAVQKELDDLVALAAGICQTPAALIVFVDQRNQRIKSKFGSDADDLQKSSSFHAHAMARKELFIVANAGEDARFAADPWVTASPLIRFYAGVPLLLPDGRAIGVLCVTGPSPRDLDPVQRGALRVLSRQVISQLESHRRTRKPVEGDGEERLRHAIDAAQIGIFDYDMTSGRVIWSERHRALWGYKPGEFNGTRQAVAERVHSADIEGLKLDVERSIAARHPFSREFRVVWPDGSIHWIQGMGEFTFDGNGKPTRMRGVAIETTLRKQAEDAVRNSEKRLRNLIDGFGPSILVGLLSPDGTLIEVNRSAMVALGLRSEDVIGIRLDETTPWNYSPVVQLQLRQAIDRAARGVSSRYDVQVRAMDGSLVDIDFSIEPVRDDAGQIVFLVPSANIVTERKQAEQHVRELNRVYAVLSDINQTIVREKDLQAMLAAACRIAVDKGRFRMAWIGLLDAPGELLRIAAHAGADAETVEIIRSLLTGEHLNCAFTFRAIEKGTHAVCNDIATDPLAKLWVAAALERDYKAMASLPLVVRGKVVGTFNLYSSQQGFFNSEELMLLDELAMDISFALELHERESGRLRVEKALRESEQRFRQLAENIEEVFWMADTAKGEMLYISPAYEKIWGRACADLYKSPSIWWDSIHPEDRDAVRKAAQSAARGAEFDETYRINRPDGTQRWVHARAFPVRDAGGTTLRIAGIAEDVTARRQLEEQYRQAQKMEAIGQLAGGIAHDFNNILLVIRGFASLLMEERQTPEALEATQQIAQAAERATNLTKQLLAFSRRQVMQRRPLDLNTVVEKLNAMLLRIVGEDVRLQVNLHAQPLMANADASLIDQMIMNLVVNARDAMPAGGTITIETGERILTEKDIQEMAGAKTGRHVSLRVTDAGSGISPENLPHIFEPFFTTKEAGKGTGLGLSTVYGIVSQHGGSIRVASTLGRGTTFEILLPAAEPPVSSSRESSVEPAARRGHETILVVEDDPHVRSLTRTVLARQGYRVLEASHGVEALDVWDRHGGAVDLLLTDMVMPAGMSGRQLAARLRSRNPDLRVVFTSGYSPEIAGSELGAAGQERFIQKPAPIAQLLATVRRALDDPSPGRPPPS